MKDSEKKRLEKLVGETDVLVIADLTADYYLRLRDRGLSVQKAFALTEALHAYICGSTFPTYWVNYETGVDE